MVSAGRPAPNEGWSSWLAVAALAALLLVVEAWIAWGGTSPGRVPGSLSETPVLELVAGQSRRFDPGRIDEGSVIACSNNGITVSAAVPRRLRFVSRHLDAVAGLGVTIEVVHRSDGSVRVRCTT